MRMEHSVRRGKYSNWTEHSLRLAVKAIVVDGRPIKSASKEYGIPRQTLQGYVKRLNSSTDGGVEKLSAGRPTTL